LPDFENRILYVDVTHTWSSNLQTGIQRVVRQTVDSWYSMNTNIALIIFHGGEYKVLPHSALANFALLYSERIPRNYYLQNYIFERLLPVYLKLKKFMPHRAVQSLLKEPVVRVLQKSVTKTWIPKETTSLNPNNADILLLELVFQPNQIAYLKEISRDYGANLTYFSYDCNPLITPHYWPPDVSEHFSNYVTLVNSSRRVWSISKTAQEDIKRFSKTDESKISFEYKWLPPFKFPDCDPRKIHLQGLEKENYILMVASYVPSKNHLGFLEALKILKAKGISIPKIYLVGGGSWIGQEIDTKVRELNQIGIQIKKYEAIRNCCLGKLYKNCSFSILPSFVEGFGLPIVESLSFGKPVVTSTSMSMGELLALPGTIGFSHSQVPSLATILEQILSDNDLLETLTSEAVENLDNLGTWQDYAAELYEFVSRGSVDK
jgi:glycosyltransferase involved in cell wall biosynthesis